MKRIQNKSSALALASLLTVKSRWKEAWQSPRFRIQCLITLCAGLILISVVPEFLLYIQSVKGQYIEDLILNLLPVHDLSLYIFTILYLVLLLTIGNLLFHPFLFLNTLQAYIVLTVMRGCCIYLFPLEPHKDIIPLVDPFIDYFFYQETVITKDLFFSGHVSIMVLLYLYTPTSWLKKIILTATLLVASFILVQHVHYTIDVLVAPLAAWIVYFICNTIRKEFLLLKINKPSSQKK